MHGKLRVWACWHPTLGYIKFNSYSGISGSPDPDPRNCYSLKANAEARCQRSGTYHAGDAGRIPCGKLHVKCIEFTWRTVTP